MLMQGYLNWRDLSKQIKRNDTLKVFTVQQVGPLELGDEAAKYMRDQRTALGACGKVDVEIILRKDDTEAYSAVKGEVELFTIDSFVEDNSSEKQLTVELKDEGFGAKIVDQQNKEFFIGEGIDINGGTFTPSTPIELQTFDPSDNSNLAGKVKAYDLKDCFTDLVKALSEDTINFESTWYDNLPDDERYCVTTGLNMRQQSWQDPYISLQDLFENISKKYNLWFFAITIDNVSTLRLEEESFITQSATVRLDDVRAIQRTTDIQRFYSNVKVGSSDADKDQVGVQELTPVYDVMSDFPYIPLITHVEETWNVEGQCTGGTSLELFTDWVIDHNLISKAIIDGDEDKDDDIFIVQYDQNTLKASSERLTDPVTGGPYIYNPELINIRVIDRYRLQGNITNNFVQTTDKFLVGTTNTFGPFAVSTEWNPTELDVDSPLPFFNDNSRWDTVGYDFTVQETGVYRFHGEYFVDVTTNPGAPETITLTAIVQQITPAGEIVSNTLLAIGQQVAANLVFSLDWQDQPAYLKKGNTAQLRLVATLTGAPWSATYIASSGGSDTFFELRNTVTAGEATTDQEASEYFAINYQFEHAIDETLWRDMEENPARQIQVFNDVEFGHAKVLGAWPQEITRNLITGETTWQLISNETETPFS